VKSRRDWKFNLFWKKSENTAIVQEWQIFTLFKIKFTLLEWDSFQRSKISLCWNEVPSILALHFKKGIEIGMSHFKRVVSWSKISSLKKVKICNSRIRVAIFTFFFKTLYFQFLPKRFHSTRFREQMEQYLKNTRGAIRLSIPVLIGFTINMRLSIIVQKDFAFIRYWKLFFIWCLLSFAS